ncbi:hypothetical protein ACLIA0_04195 [Bacillaceae bacterium W0354]
MNKKKTWTYLLSLAIIFSLVITTFGVSAEETEDAENEAEKTEVNLESELFDYVLLLTTQLNRALEVEDSESAKVLLDWAEQQIEQAQKLYDEGHVEEAKRLLEESIEVFEQSEKDEDKEEQNKEDSEKEEKFNRKHYGQNVISLALNLEKVKNPVAKAALKRNIKRALDRLEAKYGDISPLIERLLEITDEFAEDDNEKEESDETEENDSDETEDMDSDDQDESKEEQDDEDMEVTDRIEKDRDKNYSVHSLEKNKKHKSKWKHKGKGKGNRH